MATPPRGEAVARVRCAFCEATDCDVKRNRGGRLFYRCPNCYAVQPTGPGFQLWIEKHGQAAANEPAAAPEPAAPPAKTEPEPPPRRSLGEEFGL